jgi:hypothetical protein
LTCAAAAVTVGGTGGCQPSADILSFQPSPKSDHGITYLVSPSASTAGNATQPFTTYRSGW